MNKLFLAKILDKKEKKMEQFRKVKSPHDGLLLDVLEVLPDNQPIKGIVQIVHGMQEHKERYLPFMEYLAQRGYACIASDHRGHGKSILHRKDLGYFYDETAEAIVADLDVVNSTLRLRYPHVPFFMIGHSMGTLVCRKYLKTNDENLAGLILSGPVYENPNASVGEKLINLIQRYKGDRYISTGLAKLVEGSFDKKFKGDQKNRWLSTNPQNVQEFNADELCGHPFTLNGYKNLMILIQDAYDPKGWKIRNPYLPILFAAGQDDPVIKNKKEFEEMQNFLKARGYKMVQGKLYPNMRHEILNEVDRRQVFEDFYRFLQSNRITSH